MTTTSQAMVPQAASPQAAAAYILCATPRSGSTLLCDLLHGTGAAGNPHSFFRRQDFAEWADHFGVPTGQWPGAHEFDRAYLAAVLSHGRDGTGVFGLRLMWESLAALSVRLDAFYPGLPGDSARFAAAFGRPVYLYLSRQDKVAQAVSRWKAEQTGLWHVNADGSERERVKPGQAPAYDEQALSRLVAELEDHEAAWEKWFAQESIDPVRISYEALSADPKRTLATVLAALGLDESLAGSVKPATARLADRDSREWAARFRDGQGGAKT